MNDAAVVESIGSPLPESGFFLPTNTETPRFRFLTTNAELSIERDPIHDRMSRHPLYGKRIQLRSILGKTSQPVGMGVSKRRGTETGWLGIPRLSPEQTRIMESHGFALAIPGETYVRYGDGQDIDLGTEEGLYLWEWLEFASQLITDTDNYDPEKPYEGADKELYVSVPGDEEMKSANTFNSRKNATDWLYDQNPRYWYDIARLIGSGMDGANQLDVYNYLMDVAQKTPDRILAVRDDPNSKVKLLLKRLIDRGIVAEKNGVFMYNSIIVGTTEEQVLFYLMTAENAKVVDHMKHQLGVDGGLGAQPVRTQYASYDDAPAANVRQFASQPSATLGVRPGATTTTTTPPAATPVDNTEVEDDYLDDEAADNLLSKAGGGEADKSEKAPSRVGAKKTTPTA